MYPIMIQAVINLLIFNFWDFKKHWSSDGVTVDKDLLSSGRGRDTVMRMSSSATNVWKLPSAKRTFISVEEGWFRMYVADTFRAEKDGYVRKVLHYVHFNFLGNLTKIYGTYSVVE